MYTICGAKSVPRVEGRTMSPEGVHILTPSTYDYITTLQM